MLDKVIGAFFSDKVNALVSVDAADLDGKPQSDFPTVARQFRAVGANDCPKERVDVPKDDDELVWSAEYDELD